MKFLNLSLSLEYMLPSGQKLTTMRSKNGQINCFGTGNICFEEGVNKITPKINQYNRFLMDWLMGVNWLIG